MDVVSIYKSLLGETRIDTVVRKTYARFFGNDVLRVIYYRQMDAIFKQVIRPDSNCIDVGCYEGQVLEKLSRLAPHGFHWAFEPIPARFEELKRRFPGANVMNLALSDREQRAVFHYVPDCDALSGLKKRDYPEGDVQTREIAVRTAALDRLLPPDFRIDLMKIDVEGAELQVLRGAMETLRRWKPVTIFQHGLGSAEYYETRPEQVHELFHGCGMSISLMESWLSGKPPLSERAFTRQFVKRLNYIFVAHDQQKGRH